MVRVENDEDREQEPDVKSPSITSETRLANNYPHN